MRKDKSCAARAWADAAEAQPKNTQSINNARAAVKIKNRARIGTGLERSVDPGGDIEIVYEHGAQVIKVHGVALWTTDKADAPNPEERRRFDINRHRLAAVEQLITHRHAGPCDSDDGCA